MNRADRLLLKVQETYGVNNKQVSTAIVKPIKEGQHKGKWEARADLWDGKLGSYSKDNSIYSYHDSVEEAVQEIRAVEEVHKPVGRYTPHCVPILIDDVAEDDLPE